MGRLFVMVPKVVPVTGYNMREIVHRNCGLRYLLSAFRWNYEEIFGAPNFLAKGKLLKPKFVGKKQVTGRTYIEVIPLEK